MTGRPNPPKPRVGYVWKAVPEGDGWKLLAGKRCRAQSGPGHKQCGRDSVAALNRWRNRYGPPYGRVESWWAYCPDHLYGRWVEDGRVMCWRLMPLTEGK